MTDINIGAITEAINNKADRDAGNLSATGKENIVALGTPDYTAGVSYDGVASITSDVDGWVDVYALVYGNVTGIIKINGNIVHQCKPEGNQTYACMQSFLRVNKNDIISLENVYDATLNRWTKMILFPLKGVN